MGVIRKQAIAGTIYTYLGIVVGFFSMGILMPNLLNVEQVGLLKVIVSYSVLFSTLANLGIGGITVKLFPLFRNDSNGHNGFLPMALVINIVGFFISLLVFFALRDYLLTSNAEKSALFVEYYYYIIPVFFFMQLFNLLDVYLRSLVFNAIKGTVAREILQRVLQFTLIVVYFQIDQFDFSVFVFLYCLTLYIPTLYLLASMVKNGYFHLNTNLAFLTPELKQSIVKIGLLGIVGGMSQMLVFHIDSIMVNQFLGLGSTGVYSICFFFGTLVVLPSRVLRKIGGAVLSEMWNQKNFDGVLSVYKKSTINQLLIGLLVFVGIWANIDTVFKILPEEYIAGKYVILFIALSNVVDMFGGLNNSIISVSEKYAFGTYFIIAFVLSVCVSNYIFIPIWGITGAAAASLLSLLFHNVLKYMFLYYQYGFQPYGIKHFLLFVIAILCLGINLYLPVVDNYIIDLIYRSIIVGSIYVGLVLVFRISDDLHNLLFKFRK